MKKIMAIIQLTPGITLKDAAAFADIETAKFQELLDQKIIDHYYSKLGVPKFWCVVNSDSIEEATIALHSLPFFQHGFITIDIEELTTNRHQ